MGGVMSKKCLVYDCNKKTSNNFCSLHQCKANGCFTRAEEQFCKRHTCMSIGCYNRAFDNSFMITKHRYCDNCYNLYFKN